MSAGTIANAGLAAINPLTYASTLLPAETAPDAVKATKALLNPPTPALAPAPGAQPTPGDPGTKAAQDAAAAQQRQAKGRASTYFGGPGTGSTNLFSRSLLAS